MKIVVREDIHAPCALVFAIASDVKGWPAHISAVSSTELITREPIGAGTRFRETRRMHGALETEVMTFAEFEPPHRFVLTGFNHGTRYRATHEFKPSGPATELTLTFSGRPITRAARLLSPLGYMFAPLLRRALKTDLGDLKRAIEHQTSAAG